MNNLYYNKYKPVGMSRGDRMYAKLNKLKNSVMDSLERKTDALEETVRNMKGSIQPDTNSPYRVPILDSKKHLPKVTMKILAHLVPIKFALTNGRKKAIKTIKDNPANPKKFITPDELKELETLAKSWGIGAIGYTKVPRNYIFQEKAILYDNAIVFTMEMDKNKFNTAPSYNSMDTVISTYSKLGEVMNTLTDYLRKNGYSAQAGHPYKGLVLYPPLAVKAGIGWYGRHGLLITPEFGPRQRIAAIFTDIENLPFAQTNEHAWISEFCLKCGRCIRVCPGKAIRPEPIINKNDITHIDNAKCFPQFYDNCSCGICIKECVFNKRSYDDIKKAFVKNK
jgi:epoxyqueuosine reductase